MDFYTNPDKLDYEKDIDSIGRDMVWKINQSDYLRTTMYCSGHFQDEEQFPWVEGQLHLCLVALDDAKAHERLTAAEEKLKEVFGFSEVWGGNLYLYLDQDDNNKPYHIAELIVKYRTKEGRQKTVDMRQLKKQSRKSGPNVEPEASEYIQPWYNRYRGLFGGNLTLKLRRTNP